jgi:hypothetical protein
MWINAGMVPARPVNWGEIQKEGGPLKGLKYVQRTMTREEHERLYALVQNPPPGSKMEAAKVYGVDLTLNLRSLTRTPAERVREMEAALKFAEELRRAAAHLDR